MLKLRITTGFRFEGKHYPASEEPAELPAHVAKFAMDNRLAEDPGKDRITDIDKAREMAEAEAKARAEASANKNKGNAPENK